MVCAFLLRYILALQLPWQHIRKQVYGGARGEKDDDEMYGVDNDDNISGDENVDDE